MAIEKTIKINVDAENATKELAKVNKSVGKTDDSINGLTNQLDAMSGGAVSSFKKFTGGLKSVALGFKSVGTAIALSGLGLLVVTVAAITSAFKSSEEGQNKFAKIMGVIGSVTGNLIDLLSDLGDILISVFRDPKQAIIDFGGFLKTQIINRVTGMLELLPALGKAIKLAFKGNFKEAAKVAGDAVGKVAFGVENVTEKIKEQIKTVQTLRKEFAKDAQQAAKIADDRARADKLDRDLLIERAEATKEVARLREIAARRDIYNAEEQKAALLEAQEVIDAIADKQIESAKLRAEALTLENSLSKSTKEDLDAEAAAKAEVIRLEGERLSARKRLAEQLSAINLQEKAEIEAIAEAERKRGEDVQSILEEYAIKAEDLADKTETQKLERQKERALKELELLKATEEQKAQVIAFYDGQIEESKKTKVVDEEKQEKSKADTTVAYAGKTSELVGQIVSKDSKAAKAVAVGQAAISGYESVQNAFTTANKSPITAVNPAYPFIQAGIAGAFSLVQLAKIKTANPVSGGGSSSSASSSVSAPSFNLVSGTGTNQIAESVKKENLPAKTYVVGSDVTTQQELDRQIVSSASI